MPIVTPYELVVFLDLPDQTAPNDRASLICGLVIDDIHLVAGGVVAEPYPPGLKGVALLAGARLWPNPEQLWSERVGDTGSVFSGDRGGDGPSVLTPGEVKRVQKALGVSGPQFAFPKPDWSWGPVATTQGES